MGPAIQGILRRLGRGGPRHHSRNAKVEVAVVLLDHLRLGGGDSEDGASARWENCIELHRSA